MQTRRERDFQLHFDPAMEERNEDGRTRALPQTSEDSHLWRVVGLALLVKALVLLYGVHAVIVIQDQPMPPGMGWLEIWNRWDAPHYLDLARDGYVSEGEARKWIVFFPLFPWLVRAAAWIVRDHVVAAFVVSGVASVAAVLLLYRLTLLDHPGHAAWSAAVFLLIFPTSYFLHIGYSESLFLALTMAAFLAARTGCWWLAGIVGLLACLTRINGVLLVPALATEAFIQYRKGRDRRLSNFIWPFLAGFGFLIYLGINERVFGDPFTFMEFQKEFWHRSLRFPSAGLLESWRGLQWRSPGEAIMVSGHELLFTSIGLIATVWCCVSLRGSYTVWMAGNLLLLTSTSYILSVPRYTLAMFPLFILLGHASRRNSLAWTGLAVCSILGLGFFITRFVLGSWAF